MSTTLRIMSVVSFPEPLESWLMHACDQRLVEIETTTGTHKHCFEMYDLHFKADADAVIFKLIFPDVVFNDAELALSNMEDVDGPNADKSRLYEAKMNVYVKMQ